MGMIPAKPRDEEGAASQKNSQFVLVSDLTSREMNLCPRKNIIRLDALSMQI